MSRRATLAAPWEGWSSHPTSAPSSCRPSRGSAPRGTASPPVPPGTTTGTQASRRGARASRVQTSSPGYRPVESAHDRLDGGELDIRVDPRAEKGAPAHHLDLDVAHGLRLGARAERMLGIADDVELRELRRPQRADERVDRAVAGPCERALRSVRDDPCLALDRRVALRGLEMLESDGRRPVQVLPLERIPDLRGRELGALRVGQVVDGPADLLVHELGQLEAELLLEDVGDSALSRLRVDPYDRPVAAPDVGGVDRYVKDVPRLSRLLLGQGLLYGVLVGAAERREHELARIGLARRHLEPGAALIDVADRVQVPEVEVRVDPVGVEVQGDQMGRASCRERV